jgi:hypothetical protein
LRVSVRAIGWALTLAVAHVPLARAEDPAIEALRGLGAARFDPSLPTLTLERWVAGALPKGATVAWEVNDCGEQTGDPALDAGRDFPTCVGATIDVPSRARTIALLFDPASPAFVIGALISAEAHGDMYFDELGLLPAMLEQPLALRPLDCGEGAAPVVEMAYAGATERCERAGVPDGPFRAWFSTGLYLMERGTYANGAKTGPWLECDRFERCTRRDY